MEALAEQMDLASTATRVRCPEGVSFSGASIDSRTVQPGQLFVALEGEHTDGHRFVEAALARGAAAALVRMAYQAPSPEAENRLIRVHDPLRALQDLAAHERRRRAMPWVAITGSSGKTTTKQLAACALSAGFNVLSTTGNLNNHIGLPLTLLGLRPEHTAAVVEMGMSGPGEIRRLSEIAAPTMAVVTNIGPAHIGLLGSLEAIASAKLEIVEHLSGPLVINGDDPVLLRAAVERGIEAVTFGMGSDAQVRAMDVTLGENRIRFTVAGQSFDIPLAGRFNVSNALAAITAGRLLGVPLREMAEKLREVRNAPMRFAKREVRDIRLIDDAYNANPLSMAASLEELARAGGRRVAVLGDMLELGDESVRYHREAGELAAHSADLLIAVGPHMKAAAEAFGAGALWFADSKEAAEAVVERIRPGDCVLVKGSRGMAMEHVVRRIEGAG